MRVTIKDVAKRASVSTATVSVVLNRVETARVADATRERIERAARDLGYAPNSAARTLRTRKSRTIGMISDRVVTTPYAGRLILGAQEAAWERGYVLMLVSTEGAADLEEEAIATMLDRQVDGLLYATMYHRIVDVPRGLTAVPSVVVDSELDDASLTAVYPDEEQGGYDATRLMIDAGHRRIAYIRNVEDVPASYQRMRGYERALRDAGIEPDPALVVSVEAVSSGGAQATERLLALPDRPTGIFVFNDRTAIGVYRAARRAGLSIPDDLSVVGFDDQELVAAELEPGLTTIALPHQAMGQWAARTVIEQIETGAAAVAQSRIEPCPVVMRGSVGPPPPRKR